MINKIKGLGLAVALTIAPLAANALTISLFEEGNPGATVDINDLDNDGIINESLIAVGSSVVRIAGSVISDANGHSSLTLIVNTASAVQDNLIIWAGHTGFGAAADTPNLSGLSFTMNASSLVGGGDVQGQTRVSNANILWGDDTYLGPLGSLASTADDIEQYTALALNDPFAMAIGTRIQQGVTTSFDATLVAAVPVPAAGFLLVGALGGLGLMGRRRRKAA